MILARLPARPLAVIEKPSHLSSEAFANVVLNPPYGPARNRCLDTPAGRRSTTRTRSWERKPVPCTSTGRVPTSSRAAPEPLPPAASAAVPTVASTTAKATVERH